MKQLEIVKKAMRLCNGSFINYNNELILIPKFNVYFSLEDVSNDFQFKLKLCEYFSRECCSSIPYSSDKANTKYHQKNCEIFNALCGTCFSVLDMTLVYSRLGNGCNHSLADIFVIRGFDLDLLKPDGWEEKQ